MKIQIGLVVALGFASGLGCSLAFDWENESGLPCPCKPDAVCLRTTNVCVPKGSVDDYKSCSPDAEFPDDLCRQGSRCIDFRGGPKCHPRCVPSKYTTPQVNEFIRTQCGVGRTCWQVPGGGDGEGVCDTGECRELVNDCTPPQQCADFNAAGVCFTTCKMFGQNAGCLGNQACHPLAATSVTACVEAGERQLNEICSDTDLCAKTDPVGRIMVCDRPEGSSDQLRCLKACEFGSSAGCDATEACVFSRPNIDRDRPGVALGLCIRG